MTQASKIPSTEVGKKQKRKPSRQNRVYYVDLSRGRKADIETMIYLSVSFNNNSGVIIDVMIFTLYLDKFIIDVMILTK